MKLTSSARLAIFLVLLLTGICRAQQIQFLDGKEHYTDECEIAIVDAATSKVRVLGRFKFLRSEDEPGERTFRLPGTKLFVAGRAVLDDEGLRSPTESYSVSMELMISRSQKVFTDKRARDVRRSTAYAWGEMLATSEMGRLAFSTHINNRSMLVSMICESLDMKQPK